MSTLHSLSSRIAPLALIVSLLACDERSPSGPPSGAVPRELRVLNGDGQQAVAGAALPDELVVTAGDAAGRPIPGIPLQFAVLVGGGQVAPQAVTSDARGFARTRWTLGTVADSQVVEARADGVASLRLRALARPDAPATLTLSGGGGVGPVGAALADSLAVAVKDRFGNPVGGVEVDWEVTAGGGTVSPPRTLTGEDGTARAQWTLGLRVDSAQGLRARIAGLEPAAFTAHAVTAGVPLQLARRGGDGQRGPAGGVLAEPLEVVLRMPDGRPVVGALVAWSAQAEAGTVTPAVSRTDADDAASAAWRLGTAAGLARATARVDEAVLTFSAIPRAGPPASVRVFSGDGQSATRGTILADSLVARVTDAYGNGVHGTLVRWSVRTGGGHLERPASTTRANGTVRTRWAVGFTPGENTVDAAVDGLAPRASRPPGCRGCSRSTARTGSAFHARARSPTGRCPTSSPG